MSKLPQAHRFTDLSDYGRKPAQYIVGFLKDTSVTPVQVTLLFFVSGMIAIYCIYTEYYILAAIFMILKSILDAADGELARVKKTPSYTGRYLDSILDIVLNALFLLMIGYKTDADVWLIILAFIALQIQGTLYNYYYVILRYKLNGDTTSRITETGTPQALPGEEQVTVTALFYTYKVLYGLFDKLISTLDPRAAKGKLIPNWLMTLVSTFGLGFQLLIMATLLVLQSPELIIPFFITYTLLVPVCIILRMKV
ncbi:CDP-alcohol phosphatidyltransferase family protein [Dokdonia genika]|uniref:CDP-alcohol phosphatidyltransferase family protein n=1 Tax=Dokdonia genika TaxID=308113 RepID=A0ABV9LB75_9FLAO